jgi:hypothetical protein
MHTRWSVFVVGCLSTGEHLLRCQCRRRVREGVRRRGWHETVVAGISSRAVSASGGAPCGAESRPRATTTWTRRASSAASRPAGAPALRSSQGLKKRTRKRKMGRGAPRLEAGGSELFRPVGGARGGADGGADEAGSRDSRQGCPSEYRLRGLTACRAGTSRPSSPHTRSLISSALAARYALQLPFKFQREAKCNIKKEKQPK